MVTKNEITKVTKELFPDAKNESSVSILTGDEKIEVWYPSGKEKDDTFEIMTVGIFAHPSYKEKLEKEHITNQRLLALDTLHKEDFDAFAVRLHYHRVPEKIPKEIPGYVISVDEETMKIYWDKIKQMGFDNSYYEKKGIEISKDFDKEMSLDSYRESLIFIRDLGQKINYVKDEMRRETSSKMAKFMQEFENKKSGGMQ